MKQVKWAISTKIFESPGIPKIEDALKRAGIEYYQSTYDTISHQYEDIPYDIDDCVVMYGPIRFIREKNKGFIPGAFGFKTDTNTSYYMSQLPRDLFSMETQSIFLSV